MATITTDNLSGVRPAIRIKKTVRIGEIEESADFGALWEKSKTIDGTTYQVQGSIGLRTKRFPVFGTITESPEEGKSGHAQPALRLFAPIEGELIEVAVGFKKEKDGRTFYTGEMTGAVGSRGPLAFFAIDPKEPVEGE